MTLFKNLSNKCKVICSVEAIQLSLILIGSACEYRKDNKVVLQMSVDYKSDHMGLSIHCTTSAVTLISV